MLAELGIIATLLQWLHSISSNREAMAQQATIDKYLEWLRRHNHQELVDAIGASQDAIEKLDRFISANHAEILQLGERIIDVVTDGHGELREQLEDIRSSLSRLPTREEVQHMLDDTVERIQSNRESGVPVPSRDIVQYKAVGNRLAQFNAQTKAIQVMDGNGCISVDRILALHAALFPDGFAWAGALRSQNVMIAQFFGTAQRVVDLVESRVEAPLTPPDEIPEALKSLCARWNAEVEGYSTIDDEAKARALASFHRDFEVIHPFLDGNGRVGRIILDQQATLLFRTPLHLQMERQQYYEAIRIGSVDGLAQLTQVILGSVEQARRSLDME